MLRRTAACSLMLVAVAVGCDSNSSDEGRGNSANAVTPGASATSVLPGIAPTDSDVSAGDGIATATTMAAADELAESQVSASTVLPPTVPDRCDPDRVGIVVDVSDPAMGTDADQVIQIVNDNEVECEIDVSESPDAAADLEPSVRLQPVEAAQLWVSARESCDDGNVPSQDEVELRVNGAVRLVPLAFSAPCGVELWAFFPN